jgi:hypothetical protein
MPTLILENGRKYAIPGLGKIIPFLKLSEKRLTRAVRDCLRETFGTQSVSVVCEATLTASAEWAGQCKIEGHKFSYRVISC